MGSSSELSTQLELAVDDGWTWRKSIGENEGLTKSLFLLLYYLWCADFSICSYCQCNTFRLNRNIYKKEKKKKQDGGKHAVVVL